MNKLVLLALLAGAESVELDKRHRHKHYVRKYDRPHTRRSADSYAQQWSYQIDPRFIGPARTNAVKPFAEGMGEDEKVGETLHINDQDVITGLDSDGSGSTPLTVNVPQRRRARPFAEGMGEDEKVGETLHIKDQDVISGLDDVGNGATPLVVNVPQKKRKSRFAEGMGEDEKVGETLHIKDQDVISGLDDVGNGATPLVVNVPQKTRPEFIGPARTNAKRPFAEGMGEDEKVGETLHIKDQDVISGLDDVGNGSLPLVVNVPQRKRKSRWAVGMGDDEKVDETLHIKDQDVISGLDSDGEGSTPLVVNVPQKRRNSFVQFYGSPIGQVASQRMWAAHQLYADEYLGLMTEEPLEAGSGFPNTLANDEGANLLGKPGLPSQSTLSAAPEKEWQQWAQDLVDWEDNQMDMANTRLPYASTLLQVEEPLEAGSGYPNTLALPGPNNGYPGLPSQSLLSSDPEKEWQEWAQDLVDWEDNQTDMANTRLPYASTLLQLNGDHHMPTADTEPGVAIVDSILADTGEPKKAPFEEETEKVEDDMGDMSLVQMRAPDDDPSNLEDFLMEDTGIPLNMRLVQMD